MIINNCIIENFNNYNNFNKPNNRKLINLYDYAIAIINHKDYSIYIDGDVTLISEKGINIRTGHEDKFVKWRNVKEVHKY